MGTASIKNQQIGATSKQMKKALHGNRIREIRKELHLSQEAFSELLEVTPKTISRVENGNGVLSGEAAIMLYLKYGYSLDWIYGVSEISKVENQPYQVDIRDLIQFDGEIVRISIKSRLYDDLKHNRLKIVKESAVGEEEARLCMAIARQRRTLHYTNNKQTYYRANVNQDNFSLQED